MAAQRRKKRKHSKEKRKVSLLKFLPYVLGALLFIFLIYRIIVLISFKVDCSNIPTDMLSENSSIVNTIFIFEDDERISKMEVITYSKDQKKLLRIPVPTEVYVTEEGVDSYPISSMNSVGEFLEHNKGKEYTVSYMSNLLGLKFDNYVWLTGSSTDTDNFLSQLSIWNILFKFKYQADLKGNLYSNLPILNLIKEINFIKQSLSTYEYEQIDISDCCIEQVVISGDRKEPRFVINSFDEEFSKYIDELVSKEVERERVNVEVYNASNVSGLASEYARKIRHTGCRILRYDNAPNVYDHTVIYIPEPEGYINSLELIRDVVGENIEIKYERPSFITTGDIVLVLGRELSE
jgi:hypothetical protein